MMFSGFKKSLIKRFVVVKLWSNSFVGGWSEVFLWRVIKIIIFLRSVVMEKKMLYVVVRYIKLLDVLFVRMWFE